MTERDANQLATWATALHLAETTPIGIDISDYSEEWADGFLAGQRSILEEIQAGRFTLPIHPERDDA